MNRIISKLNFLSRNIHTYRRYGTTSNAPVKTTIKFFTKPDCMLCYEGNVVLENALDEIKPNMRKAIKDVDYIDICAPENKQWFECYRYDIPVLHVEREGYKKVVFMHKFDHEELVEELGQEL